MKTSGLRWISLMLLTLIAWEQRVWALLFLTALAPSQRSHEKRQSHRETLDAALSDPAPQREAGEKVGLLDQGNASPRSPIGWLIHSLLFVSVFGLPPFLLCRLPKRMRCKFHGHFSIVLSIRSLSRLDEDAIWTKSYTGPRKLTGQEGVEIAMFSTSFKQQPPKEPLFVLMVTGIYPTERNPHSGTFIKTQVDSLVKAGVEVEVIHPRPGPVLFRYISAVTQVFFKTLTGKYDIVHGHYGQWCLLARLQWTTPVVASFLGSDLLGDVTFDGHLTKKGWLIKHMSRWLCKRVDAVTVKTEEMRKAATSSNVVVYPDGIDFELFCPIPRAEARAALGWDQDRYYVLFGNDPQRPVKNYPLARAAIECLRARGVTAELVVASGLPQTTLVRYINASNALILSSISEGSPNIVKEAMACNVPVVSTNVGDVYQLIGRTQGCSVCPHDPKALAAGLEQALRWTGPTTGRTDAAYVEQSAIAQQVLAVYEQVLRGKTKHARVHREQRGRKGHAESL